MTPPPESCPATPPTSSLRKGGVGRGPEEPVIFSTPRLVWGSKMPQLREPHGASSLWGWPSPWSLSPFLLGLKMGAILSSH